MTRLLYGAGVQSLPHGARTERMARCGPVCAAFLVASWLAAPLDAQALRGRVAEMSTAAPLKSVEIVLYSDRLALIAKARTDSTGEFLVAMPHPGRYMILPRRIGYVGGLVGPFAIATRDTFELVIYLTPLVVTLNGVTIAARADRGVDFTRGFEERRARGVGSFITRQEIDKRGAQRALDLLRGLPGVIVLPGGEHPELGDQFVISNRGSRTMAGVCSIGIFVDGFEVDNETINRAYRAADFEAIEVYGVSEVPAQFKAGRGNCGAVMYWSRSTAGKPPPDP